MYAANVCSILVGIFAQNNVYFIVNTILYWIPSLILLNKPCHFLELITYHLNDFLNKHLDALIEFWNHNVHCNYVSVVTMKQFWRNEYERELWV